MSDEIGDTAVPNPQAPWEGALNDPGLDMERLRRATVGKTIQNVRVLKPSTDDEIVLDFTDGSRLVVRSWDYEGYSSGLYIHHRVPS